MRYWCSHGGEHLKSFEFHAELFDVRSTVLDALSDNGFVWWSDFGSVDLSHDIYGLEATGIPEQAQAVKIARLLRRMFAGWPFLRLF